MCSWKICVIICYIQASLNRYRLQHKNYWQNGDDHQEEEEYSNNYVYLLSPDEEEEEGIGSEDEDD